MEHTVDLCGVEKAIHSDPELVWEVDPFSKRVVGVGAGLEIARHLPRRDPSSRDNPKSMWYKSAMREWESDLIQKYPSLFADYVGTTEPIRLEIAVQDGWAPIVENLSEKLTLLQVMTDSPELYRYAQIKQKLGTLRVYMTQTTEAMDAAISEAEVLALQTCELCGKPGTPRENRTWLWVGCSDCTEKRYPAKPQRSR